MPCHNPCPSVAALMPSQCCYDSTEEEETKRLEEIRWKRIKKEFDRDFGARGLAAESYANKHYPWYKWFLKIMRGLEVLTASFTGALLFWLLPWRLALAINFFMFALPAGVRTFRMSGSIAKLLSVIVQPVRVVFPLRVSLLGLEERPTEVKTWYWGTSLRTLALLGGLLLLVHSKIWLPIKGLGDAAVTFQDIDVLVPWYTQGLMWERLELVVESELGTWHHCRGKYSICHNDTEAHNYTKAEKNASYQQCIKGLESDQPKCEILCIDKATGVHGKACIDGHFPMTANELLPYFVSRGGQILIFVFAAASLLHTVVAIGLLFFNPYVQDPETSEHKGKDKFAIETIKKIKKEIDKRKGARVGMQPILCGSQYPFECKDEDDEDVEYRIPNINSLFGVVYYPSAIITMVFWLLDFVTDALVLNVLFSGTHKNGLAQVGGAIIGFCMLFSFFIQMKMSSCALLSTMVGEALETMMTGIPTDLYLRLRDVDDVIETYPSFVITLALLPLTAGPGTAWADQCIMVFSMLLSAYHIASFGYMQDDLASRYEVFYAEKYIFNPIAISLGCFDKNDSDDDHDGEDHKFEEGDRVKGNISGKVGRVMQVDEAGDPEIQFDGEQEAQWNYAKDFEKLKPEEPKFAVEKAFSQSYSALPLTSSYSPYPVSSAYSMHSMPMTTAIPMAQYAPGARI